MSRPRGQKTAKEKRQIVIEGLRSKTFRQTGQRRSIAPKPYPRWRRALGAMTAVQEKHAKGAAIGREQRIRQLEESLERTQKELEIEILKGIVVTGEGRDRTGGS